MQTQTPFEEKLNAISHGFGAILGSIGLVILLQSNSEKPLATFSILTYGISLVLLFTASTLYHATTSQRKKHLFKIFDHISIYFLIAGTYTPVALLLLQDSKGWLLFWLAWGITLFGVFLKLFFTGKFTIFSTLLYLLMGWLIVIDMDNLTTVLDPKGMDLLILGGLFYTIGIVFYVVKKIPYHHVIWHFFVLGGALCHFLLILWYVV